MNLNPLVLTGAVVALLILVEFFHIGYLVGQVRKNTIIISRQLDEILGKLEAPRVPGSPNISKML
jgi:hypothetical protein